MPSTNELLQEGRYRINQEFAHAGSETLYDAYDTVRDANVVVKEIPVKLNKVATFSQRETQKLAFTNQAKLLTEIDHESLLHVHDFFSEIDRQYLVMESVDGDNLNELLERNSSPFDASDVIKWADQLLDALNYLHTYTPPIIHRNIRPGNVKLASNGKIKLLAYGLADGSDSNVSTMVPADNSDAENIRYSPLEEIWQGLDPASQNVITNSYDERSEQILKEPADARSDIYSLGSTLYRLITAQEPIDALERSIEILEGKPDPLKEPSKVDSRIPAEISDVLMKAMQIKRENRFDSAVIMRQVLRTAVVRLKEREADEISEQEEAAEDVKLAEQMRLEQVTLLVEQKRIEIELAQKQQNELMEQKLHEAEEQRILAEQRAAEAEKLLLEREAQKAEQAAIVEAVVEPADEILEFDETVSVVFDDAVETKAEEPQYIEETGDDPDAEVVAYEEAATAHFEPEFVEAVAIHKSEGVPFGLAYPGESEKRGLSLPIPAITGGAAALIVVAIGIWMFLPSGSKQAPQPVASQPVQTETQPQTAAPITNGANTPATVADSDPITVETSAPDVAVERKTAASNPEAKAKKTAAKPTTAEKKKAVTVDDLINDN